MQKSSWQVSILLWRRQMDEHYCYLVIRAPWFVAWYILHRGPALSCAPGATARRNGLVFTNRECVCAAAPGESAAARSRHISLSIRPVYCPVSCGLDGSCYSTGTTSG